MLETPLKAGNINDSVKAIDVLSHVELSRIKVLADKAYGTKEIRKYITHKGATYTILPKTNILKPWVC